MQSNYNMHWRVSDNSFLQGGQPTAVPDWVPQGLPLNHCPDAKARVPWGEFSSFSIVLIRSTFIYMFDFQVPRESCVDVPRTECKDIPDQVCKDLIKQIPKQVCTKVETQRCQQVPQQVCRNVPRQECKAVPKQVAKQSCRTIPRWAFLCQNT